MKQPLELDESDVSRRSRAVRYLAQAVRKLGFRKTERANYALVEGANDSEDFTFEDATLVVKHALELAREDAK
jgi:hypothetical protein